MELSGEAKVQIAAAPEKVWDLVSDITRMGEWSPENLGGEWLDGATGPAVGARFKGRNKRKWMRWSTKCTVTACSPGKEFAFLVGPEKGTRWRYEFGPAGDGTAVTESFIVPKAPWYLFVNGGKQARRGQLIEGMETTLQRLKVAAET